MPKESTAEYIVELTNCACVRIIDKHHNVLTYKFDDQPKAILFYKTMLRGEVSHKFLQEEMLRKN